MAPYDGSGVAFSGVIIARSSKAEEEPPGSPVIVTVEIPPAKATCRSSLGGFPEDTKFEPKVELAVPTD
jgi:hypothetical protein